MNVLETLATAFINTFGITQPTDKTRRQVTWFIAGLMTIVLLVLIVVGAVLLRIL